MSFTTLFFDLDDTLYDSSSGLWDAIRERMSLYMSERVGLPASQVPALRKYYYENYGTTLRGLQKHYHVDENDYLAFVHDLPLEKYLQPKPELRSLLLSLPQRRWIFTNADVNHARRVLSILGVGDCFAGIVDVRAIDFACKPELEAYHKALSLSGEHDPRNCVIFDDSPANLVPAQGLGFTTVLVNSNGGSSQSDYTVSSLLELPKVMPRLWVEQGG
jgi:pyrimidine 5'-nucleotidase